MFLFLLEHEREAEPTVDQGRRYRTTPIYSNCFFGILYLFLRGSVGEIVAVNTHMTLWPYHFVMLNKNGDAIHFMHAYPHEENPHAPWWFVGHFEGIRRSKLEERLQESGREVKFRISTAGGLMGVFFLVWILLFIPWVSAWAIYPIYWNFKWAWKALKVLYR